MSPIERMLIAAAVLAGGALLGLLVRRRPDRTEVPRNKSFELPPGLVVVTAPYCTRCANLRSRLTSSGVEHRTVNAASQRSLLADLGVTTVPTLLRVDASGRIVDCEARDFSDARIGALVGANGQL